MVNPFSENNKQKKIILLICLLKVCIASLFSSEYQNGLFIPFVSYFIDTFSNPWQHFYNLGQTNKFPYPPLMLYILSFFYLPIKILGISNTVLTNLFFKLPYLCSDLLVFYLLDKIYPNKRKAIILFYFLSPIIFYAAYLHSQVDLIPTALFLLSVYLLINRKDLLASLCLGIALSTKFHIIAALPLLVFYQFRNQRFKQIIYTVFVPLLTYLFFAFPYIFSEGYQQLVLFNKEQGFITKVFYNIINLKLYAAPLAVFLIWLRFAAYKKINTDLLIGYLGMLFSVFVLLVPPAPGWYIWFMPFIFLFPIKFSRFKKLTFALTSTLSFFYILYFLFFYDYGLLDLQFLEIPLNWDIKNEFLQNSIYTMLWAVLLTVVIANYRFSIKSNAVYKDDFSSYVIGIGGDSSAGKSTLLGDIKKMIGEKLLIIEGDGDHKWERGDKLWNEYTHLDPKANYIHKQAEDIFKLKNGKSTLRKDYEHFTGKFTEERLVSPKEYISICGLHTFYLPKLRKLIDLKIFVDTDEKLRRHWKILRDTSQRGYSKELVLTQIEKRTEDADKYINLQKEYASFIVKYYTDDTFEPGDKNINVKIKMQIMLDSSIYLEELINSLIEKNIQIDWDYSNDLENQLIVFHEELKSEDINNLAAKFIKNMEELTLQTSFFMEGHRGMIQLIVLMILAESRKQTILPYEI